MGTSRGPEGEADWILMDPEIDFEGLFARFDTFLMGRRTFEATGSSGGGSMPGVKSVVVSETLRPDDYPAVTILSENVAEAVSRLREEPGKDIWLFGGGVLFRTLLDAGLVDTVEVGIIPVLLGSGIPLVAPRTERTTLQLLGSRVYPSGIVGLEYAVARAD